MNGIFIIHRCYRTSIYLELGSSSKYPIEAFKFFPCFVYPWKPLFIRPYQLKPPGILQSFSSFIYPVNICPKKLISYCFLEYILKHWLFESYTELYKSTRLVIKAWNAVFLHTCSWLTFTDGSYFCRFFTGTLTLCVARDSTPT